MTPRNSVDHEVFEQLAAGHALSALEPEDEQAFLAHLPGCTSCARALADHTETLGHLAYGVAADEPPAALWEGIRAQLRAESGGLTSAGDQLVAPSSLTAARERRRRTVPLSTALTGLAASLVLVVSLVLINHGANQDTSQDARLAAMNRAVSALLVPGARQIALTGSDGRGVAVINGNKVSLVVSGLDANDRRSSIYVLWGKSRFGSVDAVGAFDVTDEDVAVVNGLHLANASTLEVLMITREAGRKAPAITTQTPLITGTA